MPIVSAVLTVPRPKRCVTGERATLPSAGATGRRQTAFQRNRNENKPQRIGDELARLQRVAERDPEPDDHPTEGKPADDPNDPTQPETRGCRIHRNDAEPLMMGRQQEVADDLGDPKDKKSHEQAEQRLAQQRRPIEGQERTNAAEGEGRHQTDGKGEAQSDDAQAVP